jgi:hypothetical protein
VTPGPAGYLCACLRHGSCYCRAVLCCARSTRARKGGGGAPEAIQRGRCTHTASKCVFALILRDAVSTVEVVGCSVGMAVSTEVGGMCEEAAVVCFVILEFAWIDFWVGFSFHLAALFIVDRPTTHKLIVKVKFICSVFFPLPICRGRSRNGKTKIIGFWEREVCKDNILLRQKANL